MSNEQTHKKVIVVPTQPVVAQKSRYSKSLIFSILLHVTIVSFMLISIAPKVMHMASQRTMATPKPDLTPIVEATTVDQSQVIAEVERLQAQRKAKADAIAAKQKKMKTDLANALKAKQQQQRKLALLKKQKQKLQREKQKQQAARKKQAAELAKLKKIQAVHDKEMAKAKAQADAARKAEQQAKREADQKNKALAKQQAEAKKLVQQKAQAEAKAVAATQAQKAAQQQAAQAEQLAAAAKKEKAQRAAAQARHDAVVNRFALQIRNVIERNWMYPRGTGKLTCLIALSLSPSGQVLDAKLVRSSGDPSIDRLAVAAVYKSSPLPVPHDSNDFAPFRQINLTVSTHG